MLFELGHVVMTNGIAMKMRRDPSFAKGVERSLRRHATGDWGDLVSEDKEMNDAALEAEILETVRRRGRIAPELEKMEGFFA